MVNKQIKLVYYLSADIYKLLKLTRNASSFFILKRWRIIFRNNAFIFKISDRMSVLALASLLAVRDSSLAVHRSGAAVCTDERPCIFLKWLKMLSYIIGVSIL